MSNKTIEQAYLAREQMKNEFERATESSRAALSAISGRNILKTKKETAKIRRDEEIAAQNRAAQITIAQAGQEISMEQSRLSFDQAERNRAEQKRRADRSLAEQERRSIRSAEAQELADRRQEAMDMLALGIYDPSFAADLGFSDGVVKEFAEKKNAEFQQKQAAKAKAAKAKADYEASLKAIEEAKNKKLEAEKNAKWYESKLAKAVSDYKGETEDATAAKDTILKSAGSDKVLIPWSEEIASALHGQNNTKGVLKNPKLAMLEKSNSSNVEKIQQARKTEDEVKAKQYREMADYYDRLLTESIRAKEKAGNTLSELEQSFKEKYQSTAVYAIRSARYEFNIAAESGDEGEFESAQKAYLEQMQLSINQVASKTEAVVAKTDAKRLGLEKIEEEERAELQEQITATEEMIGAIEQELRTFDFTVEQQENLAEIKDHLEGLLSSLKIEDAYAVEYEENPKSFESEREYREMDAEYGGVSVADLEGYAAEWQKAIDKKIGPSTYVRDMVRYNERQKELDRLKAYIERRKTNEKNAAEDQEVEQWAKSYAGKNWAEKVSKLHSDVRRRWEDLMQYSTIMSGNAQYARDQMTLRLEYDADGKAVYITRDGEQLPGVLEGDEETLARVQGEIRELSQKEQKITGAYHRNVVQYAEELIPDDQAAEKAKEFSLEGFSEIAKQYRHGGKYFDGNYRDYESDVEGFAKGNYGFFEKEQADRILALLAEGEQELAFSYYANVREQALLAEADSLNDWWAGTKGAFSGLTRFLTQGGYMLENMAAGSYERMAGTLGTASHQVTVEKLDQMGFGGEALETIYMGGYTILDMVPAVAVSFVPVVGQAAASGYIFAKSMATTYTEDIAAGKRSDEALTHGVLSGTAEVAMEKILGGIPGLTSKNGLFTKLKGSIEKLAVTKGAKTAIRIASSMGAEGFEEFLQEVISPFLSKIASDLNGISDAELEEIDWEEAGRSFLLGAITGGAFSVAYAPFENRAMEIEAARSLQLGEVDQLISLGAQLENKTALKIKEAMQNQQPRYKGKEGLAAFVSEKDIANIQKSIRSRRVKGAAKTLSTMIEANMEGADPAEIKQAKAIFRKVLTARTLTLEEASAIAKDERLLSILEGMMGEQLLGKELSPKQVALLARLASFTDENGKVSKARLALFKDAFGKFDTEAIEQILKYDTLTGFMEDGVLYESESTAAALDDSQQEAVETLNALSEMTGFHFLITENHATGDYLASGLMAVNPNELDQGIFYAMGHQAYQMIMQLEPEKGKSLREFILEETKKTLGEKGLENAIRKIMKHKYLKGLDCNRPMAEDELCAQLMPGYLLRDGYQGVNELAKTDIEAANALRKMLGAIQNNIVSAIEQQRIDPAVKKYVESVLTMKNKKAINKRKFKIEDLPAEHFMLLEDTIEKEIGRKVDLSEYEVWFLGDAVQHIENRHGKNGEQDQTMSRYEDYALIPWALKKAKTAEVLKNADGTLVEDEKDYNSDGTPALQVRMSVPIGNNLLYVVECVPDSVAKRIYIRSAYKNSSGNVPLLNMGLKNPPQPTSKTPSGYYATTVNNSISNLFENVNGNFLWQFYGSVGQEVSEVQARLTDLIKQDRADRYGWKNGEDTTKSDPLFDELVANYHINDDSSLIGTQQNFVGTVAMQKAGIKIDGSVGDYSIDLKGKAKIAKEYKAMNREIRNYKKRMKMTDQEMQAAKDFYEDQISDEELKKLDGIRHKVVRGYVDLLVKRQGLDKPNGRVLFARIKGDLVDLGRNDAAKLKHRTGAAGIAQKISELSSTIAFETPRRVFQIFFGLQDGAEVFARWYRPIEENNRFKNLFLAEHTEKIRAAAGGKWSAEERQVGQMLIEAQLYDDAIADSKTGESVRQAVEAVYSQEMTPGDAMKNFGIRDFDHLIQCANAYEVKLRAQEIVDNKKIDVEKLKPAMEAVKEEYGTLYDAINDFLVAHGMDPIPFIKYYTPHMQIESTLTKFKDALKRMGTQEQISDVPTMVAGRSHTYRPHKKWNPHFKERTGSETDYDLMVSYQVYLNYFASVIFHTDDIIRMRALEEAVRLEYSKEDIRERVEKARVIADAPIDEQNEFLREVGEIGAGTILSKEDAAQRITDYIDKITEDGTDDLPAVQFAKWMQDMANIRAGKQSAFDRGVEAFFDRRFLRWFSNFFGKIKAAKVAGSLTSLLKQNLQLINSVTKGGVRHTAEAITDIALHWKEASLFANEIPLLVGKKDYDPLDASAMIEGFNSAIGKPMQWVDYMTSLIVAKTGYKKAIEMGMDDQTAKQYANEFATKIMGSRQNAEKPQAFYAKNPVFQFVTAFAVEAHNSIQNLTFDSISEFSQIKRTKGKKAAMKYMMRGLMLYFTLAFFGNRAEDELMNQTPIPFDVIGILTQSIAAGNQQTAREFWMMTIDNVCEDLGGERVFETERPVQDFDVKAMFGMIGEEILDDFIIPSNILSVLGMGTGTSIMKDVSLSIADVVDDFQMLKGGLTGEELADIVVDVIAALPMPLGNQLRKTAQGTWTVIEGGNYSTNSEGEKQLLYPVTGWWDSTKSVLFGKYASYDAQKYYDTGEKPLSVAQTKAYDDLLADGVNAQSAYDTILELRQIRKDGGKEDRDAQRAYIQDLTMTDDQKMVLFKYTLSDSETVTESVEGLSAAGLSDGDIMDAYNEYREIDADEALEKEKDKATEFAYFLDRVVEDINHRRMIKQAKGFTYGMMDVVEPKEYEAMTESGVSYDDAYEVYFAVSDLEPEGDKETVSTVAKYSAIGKCKLSDENAQTALLTYATESDERRMTLSFAEGTTAEQFISVKENLEIANKAAGKESASNARIQAAIASTDGLTLRQQAVLWQLFTGSTSAKNNPFSVSTGWETIAQIEAYKKAHEEN